MLPTRPHPHLLVAPESFQAVTWADSIHKVTTKYLNGLIELIHSNLAGNQQDSASIENSKKHFFHTLEIIKSKEYEGVVLTPK